MYSLGDYVLVDFRPVVLLSSQCVIHPLQHQRECTLVDENHRTRELWLRVTERPAYEGMLCDHQLEAAWGDSRVALGCAECSHDAVHSAHTVSYHHYAAGVDHPVQRRCGIHRGREVGIIYSSKYELTVDVGGEWAPICFGIFHIREDDHKAMRGIREQVLLIHANVACGTVHEYQQWILDESGASRVAGDHRVPLPAAGEGNHRAKRASGAVVRKVPVGGR